ncbi:E3 ubiquitin-protein ligase HAKAI homolog [Apium graveolens]|uniref:E3 ubiquitin-protein ligase HAKAI homolog n=1 Tax=Apium graveolens TaxID=4045 RepID=UPI003D794709
MNREPLKIILSKKGQTSDCAGEKLPGTGKNVTAACPDHLVISDLPVAKGIGRVPTAARVKEVGFTVHTKKGGEKVHFCAMCNFPIAIYGRLIPCEHAFCRDCALECGSKGECYMCGAQIEKIQPINKGKGVIFICGVSSCLKSFCKENELRSHISEVHGAAGLNTVISGGDGDLHLVPLNGPLPRPTAQPKP